MNIAHAIRTQARLRPFQRAVVYPFGRDRRGRVAYTHYTFQQLEKESDYLAFQFKRLGIGYQTKVLLFIRPSLEFSLVSFALFKVGAVIILIDPGMGRSNLLNAIKHVSPEILIAVPEVHRAKFLFPHVFNSIRLGITTGRQGFGKTLSLAALLSPPYSYPQDVFEIFEAKTNDPCAIIFTSGGTGTPKGVLYEHRIFDYQMQALQNMFSLTTEDIDLPGFPLFSLFTLGLGMTSVIPDMDSARPAQVEPLKIIESIYDQSVTFAAGSPAIWQRVGQFCQTNGLTLPSIKSLVMFGAPVRNELHSLFEKILPNGTTYTPYGATECLPVSNISGRVILSQTAALTEKGMGTCVGTPCPNTQVVIISPTNERLTGEEDMQPLQAFEIGEIVVKGPQVTSGYYNDSKATDLAKIKKNQQESGIWHRMGDLGYIDDKGRLWFCGRKVHRVQTDDGRLFDPIPVESAFLKHAEVYKAALIGIKDKENKCKPCIVIERIDKRTRLSKNHARQFKEELLELARQHEKAQLIDTFFLYDRLPVDTRHNIKIDRLSLARIFDSKESSCL